jgi:transcription antitermination factor NusG
MEHHLPFITVHQANQMVSVTEINFGIQVPFTGHIKKVVKEQKRVMVFLCDFMQTTEVTA